MAVAFSHFVTPPFAAVKFRRETVSDNTNPGKGIAPAELIAHETSEKIEKAKKVPKNAAGDCSPRSVSEYNRLIRGGGSSAVSAISWYSDMLLHGVAPDKYTFPYLLSACLKTSNPIDGSQLHASAVKLGFRRDVFVANSFVFYYGDLGDLESARKVFDEMPEKNVVSWTSLISSYTKSGRHREAISAFVAMTEVEDSAGIEPNEITTATVISACAKLRDLDSGERVLNSVGGEISGSPVVANAVANMYMKCGDAEKARKLFDETPGRDAVLYNTLISNYARMGKANEALEILRRMIGSGRHKPDRVTLLAAIAATSEARIGMEFHGYVFRNGLLLHPGISNALVDMYGRLNRPDLARKVFDQMPIRTPVSWNSLLSCHARNGDFASATEVFAEMPERNIVSWNTMISSLVQHGFFAEAIGMFRKVQRDGTITPDEMTMVSVASACGYLGALHSAKWVYRYVEKNGIRRNVRLETALVDMFARCGETQLAMEVFRRMPERDVSAWTAAIGAMAKEGNGEVAMAIFREMIEQKFPPDPVVFSALLTACSHSGLVKQGMNAFRDMKKIYGLNPQIIHYGCVVDLLGRAGLLSKALDFISEMPIEPNAAIWRAFLAACRIHKNEEMATMAAQKMVKSDNEEVEVQILLSNIYASVGKWEDVSKVRKNMKRNCTKKIIPGSSSIEVNGEVHEFTTDDDSHPEDELVNSMLREIYSRVSDAGHVPDLNSVLHDVDEDEKQCLLSKHSEKVAIAFGLLCSCKGVTIRVVKNLRICSDCHSFAKTVSKVYRREIVIRDNNRFHFFRQGSCSCNDYW